ncbi:hypothetical protein V5O48_001510 [Marasmius crinis-equi]|uniref:C2H2-type domain-containing protein n=1 Tax=Marasmius crinis-equi TaxID=585013 RepID=A0ABR3FYD0_9AGAR
MQDPVTQSSTKGTNGINASHSASSVAQKIEQFRKQVNDWARHAPDNAFSSVEMSGVQLYLVKDQIAKNVSVKIFDDKTTVLRDINYHELAAILGTKPTPVAAASSIPTTSASISSATSTPKSHAGKVAKQSPATTPRSPAQANKQTLARDILRALGKRSRTDDTLVPPGPKRQAVSPIANHTASTPSISQHKSPSVQSRPSSEVQASDLPATDKPVPSSSSSQKSPTKRSPSKKDNAGRHLNPVPTTSAEAGPSRVAVEAVSGKAVENPTAGSTPSSPPKLGIDTPAPGAKALHAASRSSKIVEQPDDPLLFPPRAGTPLFLPSPDASPSRRAGSPDIISISDSPTRTRVLRLDYVEVPRGPKCVEDDRKELRRSKNRKVTAKDDVESLFDQDQEAAQYSLAALVQEAYAIPSSSTPERIEPDPEEEAVMKDATTRLQFLPCRWQSCDAVMNSVARLERHLKEHVENLDDNELHSNNSPLKPSADPSIPSTPSLPDCPDVVPSYMVVARHVTPRRMTREEHQAASAAVLKRIMPPTQAGIALRRTQLKRGDASGTPPLEDNYDFVAYRPSPSCRPSCAAKIRYMPDLESSEISEKVHDGLSLWKGDDATSVIEAAGSVSPIPAASSVTEMHEGHRNENAEKRSLEGPTYISSHSADVILSDMRPIKLKIDALCSINVLLDEFLFNILKSSRSLTTNKLRAGLLGILPTTLGKEALLEAEVELRAYWDRTRRPKGPSGAEDDSDSFNLQWAFELLRLKCEAYSTLNESDEDTGAESRLHERMAGLNGHQPPRPSLVAPAALYLTAILEAMCEHILSNVGRVAARDSSRTTATLQDVFVALCEDDSIYGLFKTMNVYEHIEQQAQETKSRRSKSISRTDKLSMSRTSSRDGHSPARGSFTPPRVSSEGSSTVIPGPAGSRTSFEKARSIKKFMPNGRNSGDRETSSVNGHKKSDSSLSERSKQAWVAYTQQEDDGSLQEFDDLMRSDATMKVSLTPDRLRTMEVYKQEKQEKDQRVNRSKVPDTASLSSRTDNRRPSLHNVHSIQEDEEENQSKVSSSHQPRIRQLSVASLPSKAAVLTRTRSTSASGSSLGRKSSKTAIKPSHPPPTMQTQNRSRVANGGRPQGFDADPFPPRTRKKQVNRESLDLDDVMAGSDAEEDEDAPTPSKVMSTPKRPPTSSKPASASKVSASTRELMDFLNEGPPETPNKSGGMSKSGRELMDFLDNGPPTDYSLPPVADTGKNKGSGRLQRMMSKLNIGSEKEKSRNPQNQDDFTRRPPPMTPISPSHRGLSPKSSAPNLSMLANRPVPPRPPQPQMISPPSSPVQAPEDPVPPSPAPRTPITRKIPSYDLGALETSTAAFAKSNPPSAHENGHIQPTPSRTVDHSAESMQDTKSTTAHVAAKKTAPRVQPPSLKPSRQTIADAPQNTPSSSGISAEDLQALRRHIARATNSDECRLIMDVFLSKAGIPIEPVDCEVPYPSPTEATPDNRSPSADIALEVSLVELLLGGEHAKAPPVPRKKNIGSRNMREPAVVHKMNGLPVPVSRDAFVVKD